MSHQSQVESKRRFVVPGPLVELSGQAVAVPTANAPLGRKTGAGQPTVHLVREGDAVRAIDVTCSCGERIRLKCLYEEGGK